jgi:hypothetical protein
LFCEAKVLSNLLVGCCFHQHGRDLIVSARHRAIGLSDFLFSSRQSALVLFDLGLSDETFFE